jgi:hypothetical protein
MDRIPEPGNGWTCPWCNYGIIINEDHYSMEHIDNFRRITVTQAKCPRSQCEQYSYQIYRNQIIRNHLGRGIRTDVLVFEYPPLTIRTFPNEANIPGAVIEDYKEALLILNQSPKAAATLLRRALQGMIRDRFNVSGQPTLYHEIDAITDQISPEIRQALLDIKDIGNIGAHMQQDVNLIIEVDAEEVQTLSHMVELLINEWYVQRMKRENLIQKVRNVAQDLKDAQNNEDTNSDSI